MCDDGEKASFSGDAFCGSLTAMLAEDGLQHLFSHLTLISPAVFLRSFEAFYSESLKPQRVGNHRD